MDRKKEEEENDPNKKDYLLIPISYWNDLQSKFPEDEKDKQKIQKVDSSLTIKFRVGPTQTEIEASKIILEGYSPMFRAMYSEVWTAMESGDKNQVINLPEVNPESFSIFLRVLSATNMDRNLLSRLHCTVNNVLHLLNLSKMYMVEHVQQPCRDFLLAEAHNEDPISIVLIYETLKNTEEDKVKGVFYNELKKNFGLVVLVEEALQELSEETWIKLLGTSVGENDFQRFYPMNSVNETEIFMALLRWGMMEQSEREGNENLFDIIKLILPFLLATKICDTELDRLVLQNKITQEDWDRVFQELENMRSRVEEEKRKREELEEERRLEKALEEERRENIKQQYLKQHKEETMLRLLKFRCEDFTARQKSKVTNPNDAQVVTGTDENIEEKAIIVGHTKTRIRGNKNQVDIFLFYFKSAHPDISVEEEEKQDESRFDMEDHEIINLPKINPNLFEKFLKVLQTEYLGGKFVSAQNITLSDITDFVDLFQIYFVEKQFPCIPMSKDPGFFLGIYELYKDTDDQDTLNWAISCIKMNFKAVLSNDVVLAELSKETWIKILAESRAGKGRKYDFCHVKESEIFNGLVRWGEIQCRKQNLEESEENVNQIIHDIRPFILFDRISKSL